MAKKKPFPPRKYDEDNSPPIPTLTKAEEFYIENNQNKTDLELSNDLLKPIDLVRQHIHQTQSGSRVSKLLVREKGCVTMTEGASMAADESRKGYVTERAIQNAADRGDYEEATRLQKIFREQQQQVVTEANKRTENYIHHINGKGNPHGRRV